MPLLIVPLGSDQHENARLVSEAGAGRQLARPDAGPAAIRAAVSALVSEPRYTTAAKRLAEEVARLPSPQAVVPLIEAM